MTSDVTTPSGLDLTYRDDAVRVQDDLFAHVNGKWLHDYEIPADRAVDGAFRTLYDRAELDVQTIIQRAAASDAAPGSDERKIGDLYSSFMDAEAVEAAALTPIADELAAVRAVADRAEFAALLGRLQRTGIGGPLSYYVDTDDKNSQRYLVHATQAGIGLPDESYYR
ncbi:peptidase M13, partial [Nocardia gipuzkoensis]